METSVRIAIIFSWSTSIIQGRSSGPGSWRTGLIKAGEGVCGDSSGNVFLTGDTNGGLHRNTNMEVRIFFWSSTILLALNNNSDVERD